MTNASYRVRSGEKPEAVLQIPTAVLTPEEVRFQSLFASLFWYRSPSFLLRIRSRLAPRPSLVLALNCGGWKMADQEERLEEERKQEEKKKEDAVRSDAGVRPISSLCGRL